MLTAAYLAATSGAYKHWQLNQGNLEQNVGTWSGLPHLSSTPHLAPQALQAGWGIKELGWRKRRKQDWRWEAWNLEFIGKEETPHPELGLGRQNETGCISSPGKAGFCF